MERGVRLIGNGQAPVQMYWDHLLSLIQQDKLDPMEMVTHRIKLEDMDLAYQMFDARQEGVQKIYVQTKFSHSPSKESPVLTKLQ